MNSCLYECTVMHHRLEPRRHRFAYRLFMFYLDLDEIPGLAKRLLLMGHNRFNMFSFREDDHVRQNGLGLRDSIGEQLRSHGVTSDVGRMMLLTHLSTLGYAFNPVSFYFCYDQEDKPLAVVVEVGNTFGEQKIYVVTRDHWTGGYFQQRQDKFFYVSPYIDMDATFEFRMAVPDERLRIQINDFNKERKFFLSTLSGSRRELTNRALIFYALRFPLITLRVIALIHWEAAKLYLKKLPFYRKHEFPELQREVYHGRRRSSLPVVHS